MRRVIWSWSMTAENRGWAGTGVCLLWGFGLELGGVGLCGVEGGWGVLYKWWLHTVWPISLRAVKSIRSISVSPWSERGAGGQQRGKRWKIRTSLFQGPWYLDAEGENVMLELLMTPMLMLRSTMVMMRSVMMHQYSKSVNLDGLIWHWWYQRRWRYWSWWWWWFRKMIKKIIIMMYQYSRS